MLSVTRVNDETSEAIRAEFPDALIDDVARCAAVGAMPAQQGQVCVVSAGTSDVGVAEEAVLPGTAGPLREFRQALLPEPLPAHHREVHPQPRSRKASTAARQLERSPSEQLSELPKLRP